VDQVGQRGGQGPERCQHPLAGLEVAGVGDGGHDDQPAVLVGRQERQRRGGQDVGDGRQLLGGRVGGGDEPGHGLGGGGEHQQAAEELVDRVQPVLEAGGDAEVAAAAAQRPEQLRMRLRVDLEDAAVGGDQFGGQQAVDGEAVLADQVADAAAQGEAADADRGGVAEPGRQPVGAHLGGVGPGGQAGLGPGGAPLGVEVEGGHGGQVQHDPAVGGAVAGEAVAAAADRQLQPAVAGQGDDLGDVAGGGGSHDGGGVLVEAAVEQLAGLVVGGVVGGDHLPVEDLAQVRDRVRGVRGVGGRHGELLCRQRHQRVTSIVPVMLGCRVQR
jgi:hypothetical protein